MRLLPYDLAACLLLLLAACQPSKQSTLTVAEGTVYDKYTRKPLGNVSVVARRFVYGNYGTTVVDSAARTQTDSNGHYRLEFMANATTDYGRGRYRIQPGLDHLSLYNLTSYPDYTSYADGLEIQPGSSATFDFQLVPLIPTKVILANLSKQGRQAVNVYLQADEQDGQGYFSTQQIVNDTVRLNQQIFLTKLVYTVPYRTYILTAYRSSTVCANSTQCQATNVSYEKFRRPVAYPDTAIIQVP